MGLMPNKMRKGTLNRHVFLTNPTNNGASLFAGKLEAVPLPVPETLRDRIAAMSDRDRLRMIIQQTWEFEF